jgi:hypothetical protein
MRTTYLNLVRLPVVLAIVFSLIAIASSSASAAAAITVTPNHGTVGTEVTIQAGGFIGGGNLTVRFDGIRMTTTPPTPWTDENGEATFTGVIPAATCGSHYISVSDFVSSAGAFFEIEPKVQITYPESKSGPVGTFIILHGSGFAAAVGGYVKIEDATQGNITLAVFGLTDLSGSFWAGNVTIPSVSSGNHTVWALDLAGASTWTASYAHNDTFVVTSEAEPSISVMPESGGAGISVTVHGYDFTANGYIPVGGIMLGNSSWNAEAVTIDAIGQFEVVLVVPLTANPGVNVLYTTDNEGQTAYATFEVYEQTVELSPASGLKGTILTLTGSYFTPNCMATISVTNEKYGTRTLETLTVSSNGSISWTYRVKAAPFAIGLNTIIVQDSNGKTASAIFTLLKK